MSTQIAIPRAPLVLDFATLAGLGIALALVALPIVSGGSLASYLDAPSLAFVFGGTILLMVGAFPMADSRQAAHDVLTTVFRRRHNRDKTIHLLVSIAEYARRFGPLKLQGDIYDSLAQDPLLQTGVGYVIDGMDPKQIEAILTAEQDRLAQARLVSVDVLRKGAELAPAMGLIGTLIGLVRMLGELSNPEAIGPAMAIALLTTFYGAILGNMVLAPLASKLERTVMIDYDRYALITKGVAAIARRENPQRMELLLSGAPAEAMAAQDPTPAEEPAP